eukprot:142697-Chlamydomonas_euryale.AAC.1
MKGQTLPVMAPHTNVLPLPRRLRPALSTCATSLACMAMTMVAAVTAQLASGHARSEHAAAGQPLATERHASGPPSACQGFQPGYWSSF